MPTKATPSQNEPKYSRKKLGRSACQCNQVWSCQKPQSQPTSIESSLSAQFSHLFKILPVTSSFMRQSSSLRKPSTLASLNLSAGIQSTNILNCFRIIQWYCIHNRSTSKWKEIIYIPASLGLPWLLTSPTRCKRRLCVRLFHSIRQCLGCAKDLWRKLKSTRCVNYGTVLLKIGLPLNV